MKQASSPTHTNWLTGGFSAKEKQMVASNWLLNRELLAVLEVSTATYEGSSLKKQVLDGTLHGHLITWLSLPEDCYRAERVKISFRKSKAGSCLPYAVIKLAGD